MEEHAKPGIGTWSSTFGVELAAPRDKYNFNGELEAVFDSNSNGEGGEGRSATINVNYVIGVDKRSRSLSLDLGTSRSKRRLNGKLCIQDDCYDLQSKLIQYDLEREFQFSFTTSKQFVATAGAKIAFSRDRRTRFTSFQYSLKDPESKLWKEGRIRLYKKLGTVDDMELSKSDVSFSHFVIIISEVLCNTKYLGVLSSFKSVHKGIRNHTSETNFCCSGGTR